MKTFTVTCPYEECAEEFDVTIPDEDLLPGGEIAGADCPECASEVDLIVDPDTGTVTAVAIPEDELDTAGDDQEGYDAAAGEDDEEEEDEDDE